MASETNGMIILPPPLLNSLAWSFHVNSSTLNLFSTKLKNTFAKLINMSSDQAVDKLCDLISFWPAKLLMMRSTLVNELEELIASWPSFPGLHFAYIGLPLCRDPERDLLQILEELVRPWSTRILLVTNDYEVSKHEASPTTQATDVISFATFLSALESSLGPDGWVTSPHEESLPSLPQDAFIVMDLDPSLPSDCCLALLGLVKWAEGTKTSRNTRILITSIGNYEGLVSSLVGLRQLHVARNRMGDRYPRPDKQPRLDHVHEPQGDRELIEEIYEYVRAETSKTQLIICFGEADLAADLQSNLAALKG